MILNILQVRAEVAAKQHFQKCNGTCCRSCEPVNRLFLCSHQRCLFQGVGSANPSSRWRIPAGETRWSWDWAVVVQAGSLWNVCLLLRHYRPIYISLPNMPQFNLRGLPPCSPFLADDKDSPGKKHRYGASLVWVQVLWMRLIEPR